MSANVICFASAKGGAGKTVVTATVGTFLAALGKRVLIIDTDAATNGLTLFYIKEVLSSHAKQAPDEQPSRGLFEVDETTERFSHVQLLPGLELLPATYQFINT